MLNIRTQSVIFLDTLQYCAQALSSKYQLQIIMVPETVDQGMRVSELAEIRFHRHFPLYLSCNGVDLRGCYRPLM